MRSDIKLHLSSLNNQNDIKYYLVVSAETTVARRPDFS
jgi:hypothetical protein